jgi:tetratricopeptide (TPR) repeat protein
MSWLSALVCLVAGFLILHSIIATHELGHALTGRLVGIKISNFLVGAGHRLIEFKLGHTLVTWKLFPRYGQVHPVKSLHIFSVTQRALFLLGGIIAEILLAWVIWKIYESPTWHNVVWFTPIGRYMLLTAGFFLFVTIVSSLRPSTITIEGVQIQNDALALVNLWKWRGLSRYAELISKGDSVAAADLSKSIILKNSNDPSALITISRFFEHEGNLDVARYGLEKALLKIPKEAALRTEVLDVLVCLVLNYGRSDWLQDADQWSIQAMTEAPSLLTLKGTRGSVLAEMGRNSEAQVLLMEVLASTKSDNDRAYCFAYLAWIEAQEGKHESAAEKIKNAKSFNLQIPAIARLEKIVLALKDAAS